MSLSIINDRLSLVEILLAEPLRDDITSLLRRSSDTLRLLQKFSIGKGSADDLIALARTMAITYDISTVLEQHLRDIRKARGKKTPGHGLEILDALSGLLTRLDTKGPSRLAQLITNAIDEDGLSQQHLAEEAETVAISEMMGRSTLEGGLQDGTKQTKKVVSRSSSSTIEEERGDIWIMRKRCVLCFVAAVSIY